MADLLSSLKDAFRTKEPAKPASDTSHVVVYDEGADDFVTVPAEVAQRNGMPALLGIKPANVPKDAAKRKTMVTDWKWARGERLQGRVPDYSQAPSKRKGTPAPAKARRQVVVDDPDAGLRVVDASEAANPKYTQMLGIKPESLPKDATELALATARVRARRDADEEAPEMPAAVKRALGGVDTVADMPAPRIDAPPTAPTPPAGLEKVPAVRALQDLQQVTDKPAPLPAARPVVAPPPEPMLDVSPVGASARPALPRLLNAPPMADADGAALLALANKGRAPAPVAAPPPMAAAPQRIPTPAPAAAPAMAPRPPPVEDVPALPPAPVAAPKAPPSMDVSPSWDSDFAPASTRMSPEDSRAMLALAGSAAATAGARAATFSPAVAGLSRTPQGYAPTAMPSATEAQPTPDAELLAQLRAAQRADGFSSGFRALGDQFRDAMNLILNRNEGRSRMADAPGGYVADFEQQQALKSALEQNRRANRLADATVSGKERDATKDAATMEAAKAKAEKTAKDAATAAALNDPASPESGRIRETVTQLLGQRVDASTLAKLSGAELKDVALKYGVSLTNAEQNAGLRALQIQQSGEDADQAAAIRRATLDIQLQELELAKQRLQQQQAQFDASLADKEQARTDAREDKTEAHNEKMAQLNVGGFSFDPKNPPSITGAKTMAEVSVAKDEVLGSLNRLEALYAEHGPTMIGPVAGQMETEWMNITNRLRTLNEMGVPNGADYMMLAKQLQDPTSIRAKGTSAARAQAQFTQLRDQVKRKVDATAKAYKYTPASGRTSPSTSMPTGADGNPTLDSSRPRPVIPPISASSSGVKTVSIKGMKPGDLKASLAEGEMVRYPVGGGQYQVVQRKGDKLVKVRVE